jgi:hypothetical protein
MNFSELYKNFVRVASELPAIVLESAMEVKETIADLQVSQLVEGKTEKNTSIQPKYQSKVYAQMKKAIGAKPRLGTPDLKVTGDFHSGIYAKVEKDYIVTDSTDSKTGKLTDKYPDIWGLTKRNQAELNKEIKPVLQKRLRNEITRS